MKICSVKAMEKAIEKHFGLEYVKEVKKEFLEKLSS
jgi:hypothetical protein